MDLCAKYRIQNTGWRGGGTQNKINTSCFEEEEKNICAKDILMWNQCELLFSLSRNKFEGIGQNCQLHKNFFQEFFFKLFTFPKRWGGFVKLTAGSYFFFFTTYNLFLPFILVSNFCSFYFLTPFSLCCFSCCFWYSFPFLQPHVHGASSVFSWKSWQS